VTINSEVAKQGRKVGKKRRKTLFLKRFDAGGSIFTIIKKVDTEPVSTLYIREKQERSDI
jgi:hypothetical protein